MTQSENTAVANHSATPKPIVVGIDGSDAAMDTTRWAARYAARAGIPLRLVHALVVPDWLGSMVFSPATRNDTLSHEMRVRGAHLLADAAAEATKSDSCVVVDTRLVQGHIAQVFEMESSNARLVVVGARSFAPGRDLGIGPDATAMSTRTRCPLIVHRSRSRDAVDRDGAVLVGVDTSDASDSVLVEAMQFAHTMSMRVTVAHSYHLSTLERIEFTSGLLDWDRFLAAREHVLAERINPILQKFPSVDITLVCRSDEPADLLMSLAHPGDVVVVGSHQQHRLAGTFRQSVSENLIRHAPCSVMIARSSTTTVP